MMGPKRPANWSSMTAKERQKWTEERNKKEQQEKEARKPTDEEDKSKQQRAEPTKPAGIEARAPEENEEEEYPKEESGAEVVLKVRGEEVESMTLRELAAHVVSKIADIIRGTTD